MSAKNKKVVLEFMNGFIEGKEDSLINFLTEDIRWNIVGMPAIKGKQNFLQAMEMMDLLKSTSLNGSRTSEMVRNMIAEKDFVVVESSGVNNNYSNCDIFRIRNGKIDEMTSYIVDTSASE